MSAPITPPLAINPIITIQPVATAPTHRDLTGPQALLALLSDGSIVRGFVVNRDQKNNPIIRTASGDFVVESDGLFIKTGSEIAFKVDSTQPSLARIISIDDQTPEAYSLQNLRPALAEDTIAESQLATTQSTTTPGQPRPVSLPLLQAVVLQALTTAPTLNVPQALNHLQAGTPLNLTLHDVQLPPVPVALSSVPNSANLNTLLPPASDVNSRLPAASPSNPQAALPSSIAAPLAAAFFAFDKAQNLAAAGTPQTPGFQPLPQSAHPSPQAPPNMPSPTTVTLPNGQLALQATVIGHGEDGSNIVHTPFATVKIYTAQPLPTGTNLIITAEVTSPANPAIPVAQAPAPAPNLPLPPSFQYLAAAIAQLIAADPAMAREFLQQLPVMGPRFTSGLLFFLGAVKSGERRGVFNALEIGRIDAIAPGLLAHLSRDIRELHQSFTNPPFDEWKPVHLPLIFGSQVETAKLYVRREPDESGSKIEKTSGSSRFLLDLNLSELGQMQLDGFVRNNERGKALELFLRSAGQLDDSISQDIRGLFTNALETTGMKGNLIFQQGAEHFVKPQPKPPAPPSDMGRHTILA